MADERKDRQREFALLTAQIAAAYLSNHSLALAEVPGVISSVHAALREAVMPAAKSEAPLVPKVSVKRSVTPDYLVCLES
jgi:predicted transcriptional regulator